MDLAPAWPSANCTERSRPCRRAHHLHLHHLAFCQDDENRSFDSMMDSLCLNEMESKSYTILLCFTRQDA